MASYQPDRFDDIPRDLARVGAHRAPRTARRGWVTFAWAALASGVLVIAGIATLGQLDDRFSIDLPWASAPDPADDATDGPAPEDVPAITDPGSVDPGLNLSISVFNGSPTAGAQTAVGDQLAAVGWPIGATSNASTRDIETTVVYYSSAAYEGIAKGMIEALGVGSIQLSDAFPGAPVTIVLGADYPPPAG